MKSKVVKTFMDKYKKTIHKTGEIIEVSKERFEEINSTSLFLKKITKKK